MYRSMHPEVDYIREASQSSNPLDELRDCLRVRHYARSTEKSYLHWCGEYLRYCLKSGHDKQADSSFRDYMTHLALVRKVASSTQNQAYNSVLFLFRNVWEMEPSGIDAVRARKPHRLPTVLSPEEVAQYDMVDACRYLILPHQIVAGIASHPGNEVDLSQGFLARRCSRSRIQGFRTQTALRVLSLCSSRKSHSSVTPSPVRADSLKILTSGFRLLHSISALSISNSRCN